MGLALLSKPVIISGGGIGGLCAALALARAGLRSIVLERAPVIAEIGAGIQLGPNAFHVFERLGISDLVRRTAVFIDRCRLMDGLTAEQIAELTIDTGFVRHFGQPYAVVHRAELHAVMREGCSKSGLVELRTSSQVIGYDQDGKSVAAFLATGEEVSGVALIGADGLWSTVRRQLASDGAPRVTGHTTYRAVIPKEDMPAELCWNDMALWAAPNCHIVHYPLSGRQLFNLVVTYHNHAPEPVAGVPASADEVELGFEHVHPLPRSIIASGQDWRKWVLCDRDPLDNWCSGRVALLGDAAHPTLQYMAQGACMALEDSVVLAAEIAGSPADIEGALQRYQRRRLLRTSRIVLLSREMGNHVFHPSGVHAALRNQIMRAKTQQDWWQALDWLYKPADLLEASREIVYA